MNETRHICLLQGQLDLIGTVGSYKNTTQIQVYEGAFLNLGETGHCWSQNHGSLWSLTESQTLRPCSESMGTCGWDGMAPRKYGGPLSIRRPGASGFPHVSCPERRDRGSPGLGGASVFDRCVRPFGVADGENTDPDRTFRKHFTDRTDLPAVTAPEFSARPRHINHSAHFGQRPNAAALGVTNAEGTIARILTCGRQSQNLNETRTPR